MGPDPTLRRTALVFTVVFLSLAFFTAASPIEGAAQAGGGGGSGPSGGKGNLPDLVVRDLTPNTTDVAEGDTVTFTYELANEGHEPSGEFQLARSFEGDDSGGGGSTTHPGLEAGEVEQRSFEWTADAGNWTVKVTADAGDEVEEFDETNNDDSLELFVEPLPDLVVRELSHTPEDVEEGDTVTFTYELANTGSKASGEFGLTRSFEGENSKSGAGFVHPGLDAGEVEQRSFEWTASEGNWTVGISADPDEDLEEVDETNNDDAIDVSVDPLPDLVVRELSHTPEDVQEGDTVTFTYELANTGSKASGEFGLTRSFEGENSKSGAGFLHDGLDAGEVEQRSFEWTATAGNWTVGVTADGADDVNEVDETNNDDAIDLSVEPLPDLSVVDVSLDPEDPRHGDSVRINYTIRNEGSADASSFEARECLQTSGHEECSTAGLDPLPAGEQRVLSVVHVLEEGEWNASLEADPFDDVEEVHETNNLAWERFHVAGLPDLAVTGVDWSPEQPQQGDEVTFEATLENLGDSNASGFEFDLRLHQDGSTTILGQVEVDVLEPGQSLQLQADPWTAQEGEFSIQSTADPGDFVDEDDETNNELEATGTVAEGPNLVVSDLVVPEDPREGESLEFTAEITNLGDVAAEATQTALALNGTPFAQVSTPSLDPGANARVVASETLDAGSYTLSVTADVEDAVAESEEADNTETQTLEVGPARANLRALDLFLDPPQPVEGQDVGLTGVLALENQDLERARVHVTRGQTVLASDHVENLSAGETLEVEFPEPWSASPGEHELSLLLDPYDDIVESRESDNRIDVDVDVSPAPDPAVRDLDVEASQLRLLDEEVARSPWAERTVRVHLENDAQTSMQASAGLSVDACPAPGLVPLPPPAQDCERVLERDIELGAQEEVTVETGWRVAGKVGDWTLTASLDYEQPQGSTANDVEQANESIIVGGTGLGGADLSPRAQGS